MEKRKRQPHLLRQWMLKILLALSAAGIARWIWGYYFASIREPLWLFTIPLVFCPFVALVVGFGGLLLSCLVKATVQTKSAFPLLLLAVGLFVIFQIPPPDPTTPEKAHFLAHRADYEAVVQLVRQNALDHADCEQDGYRPPPELAYVSSKQCLRIDQSSMTILFYPLERHYHFIAYKKAYRRSGECPDNSEVEQEIDARWVVCVSDDNWG